MTLDELRDWVDHQLAQQLAVITKRLVTYDESLNPIANELRDFSAGGKRIRPVVLLLGHGAAGGTDFEVALGPALALELLHTCALVHDDVIDRAKARRGRPTVHHAFAARHMADSWAGDSRSYGEAIAILLGDLAFVHADELFFRSDAEAAHLLPAFRRFTSLREEVMAGQYLDLQSAATRASDRDLALKVATLKSARYSVTRPLQIGAAIGGADAGLIEGLRGFGDPLGRAFQVRDDLLGLFGDEAQTGKSASSDLVEGKRTLLVAEAMSRLASGDRERLQAGLGDPDLDEDEATHLRDMIDACGARESAEQFVASSVNEALEVLSMLDVAPSIADQLRELAARLASRVR